MQLKVSVSVYRAYTLKNIHLLHVNCLLIPVNGTTIKRAGWMSEWVNNGKERENQFLLLITLELVEQHSL